LIRLRDVVEPFLQATKRLVNISQIDVAMDAFVHVPVESVLLPICDSDSEALRPNDLVMDAVGLRVFDDGFLAHIRCVLDRIPSGAVAVFIVKDHYADVPRDEIHRVAKSVGCQLIEVAQLAYPAWRTAVVAGREMHPPVVEGTADEPPAILVVGSDADRAGAVEEPAADPTAAADRAGLIGAHRQQRLEMQLRERDRRIARLEQQLNELRTSTSLQLGAALVEVAKRPTSISHLPSKIVGLWAQWRRDEGTNRPPLGVPGQAQADTAQVDPSAAVVNEDGRFLAGLGETVASTSLEIFGLVTDSAATALSDYASLYRPLPHDAKLALERTNPALVLIQARALMPPTAWAHAATPGGAVSRTRALQDVTDLARDRSIPVVVWLDVPLTLVPALGSFARQAGLVVYDGHAPTDGLQWSPGVPLTQFHPVDKTVTDRILLFDAGAARLSTSLESRLREALERADLATTCSQFSPRLPDEIRCHSVVLASPFVAHRGYSVHDSTLAALASGGRILSGHNDSLLAAFPAAVVPVQGARDPVAATRAVLALPNLPMADVRHNLRRVFDYDATPVRLARLAAELGLSHDPLVDRRVTALVRASDMRDLASTLDSLLGQEALPTRLIIAAERIPDRALEEVEALGVATTIVASDRPFSAMAALADSRWVTIWDGAGTIPPRQLLKDLLAAAESMRAEVVGTADDPSAGYGRYVGSLPSVRSLIRRDQFAHLGSGNDVRVLAERGARLFGVNYTGAAN
jgi:hypothetical protein